VTNPIQDFNQRIIDEFRAHHGRVGGPFEGGRLILLTTTGARTGTPHTTPVGYFPDGGERVLVGHAGTGRRPGSRTPTGCDADAGRGTVGSDRISTSGAIMTVTGIITAIVVGLIIGALGRLVVPGKQNIPIWLTIIVGIVAALIGTAIARALGVADTRGFDWIELIIQVVLAAIGVTLAANAYGRRGLRH